MSFFHSIPTCRNIGLDCIHVFHVYESAEISKALGLLFTLIFEKLSLFNIIISWTLKSSPIVDLRIIHTYSRLIAFSLPYLN